MSSLDAKIKKIYIELNNYQFLHKPYDDEDSHKMNPRFVGRKTVKKKIKTLLTESISNSGTYLITGFRGMGKTSLLRQAIADYNSNRSKNNESIRKVDYIKKTLIGLTKRVLWILIFTIFITAILHKTYHNSSLILFYISLIVIFGMYVFTANDLGKIKTEKSELSSKNFSNETFKSLGVFLSPFIPIIIVIFFFYTNNFLKISENHNSISSSVICFFSDWKLFILIAFILFPIVFFMISKYRNQTNENYVAKDWHNSFWEKNNAMVFWSFTKVFTFFNIAVFILLFLVYPTQFCDDEKFGFACYTTSFAHIPQLFSTNSKYIVAIIGLAASYTTITFILFIHDFIRRTASRYDLLEKKIEFDNRIYQTFEINLSQETINDREVLKRINDKLLEFWINNEHLFNTFQFQRKIYRPWLLFVGFISTGKRKKRVSDYYFILEKLQNLQKRLAGAVSMSQEMGSDPGLATTFVKGMSEITIPIGKISDRNTVNYNQASAKEAEDELITIFNEIDNFDIPNNKTKGFIFIIDELDKIEPQSNSSIDEREFSNPGLDANMNMPGSREYRKRQEAVAKLLANLKGFLNAANAKFFFIGGRELFDADLADIADRDSFYSSIFNTVIYVDSFYKDKPKGSTKGGISSLTETFLVNLIMKESEKEELFKLKELYKRIGSYDKEKNRFCYFIQEQAEDYKVPETGSFDQSIFKIFTLLQNYIIYLTYRGTGSPKKLTSLVEKLIVRESYESISEKPAIILTQKKICTKSNSNQEKLFLMFTYSDQYEINLTTDILRPYLITNSRFLANLGDKLLFSTPFIFDHIIKFYPYGFSWRNLELIPEVVLVNKEPYLRNHIKSILNHLFNYHIKHTVSGLYEYKFHSIVRKELSILTKRSDLASAAFNFTLDESLLVKRHYKKKLIELREKYKGYQPLEGDNMFIHSLSFVQTVLGDLYFYDKEYDEATLYYTESIQSLRLPNGIDNRFLTRHQYLIWLRNKLKIGLTMEKMEAYDSAISIYRTLMIDCERYLRKIVNSNTETFEKEVTKFNKKNKITKETKTHTEIDGLDPRSENHRNVALITLPFIAQLSALEKNRTDGLTYANLYSNKEELREIIDPQYNTKHLPKLQNSLYLLEDQYRKGWLWADYFNNVGSILFFKNCQFTRFFTPNVWESNNDNFVEDEMIRGYRQFTKSEYEQDKDHYEEKSKPGKAFNTSFYLKTDFSNLFKQLHQQYYKDTKSITKRSSDFYPSLTSICYYWEALHELTKQHNYRIYENLRKYGIRNSKKEDHNPLHYAAYYLLPEFVDMVDSKRFYYLGNIVSKIGDAVLASLGPTDKSKVSNKLIAAYDNFKKILQSKHDKTQAIEIANAIQQNLECTYSLDKSNSIFNLKKVLFIYTLATELYRRSGQDYYYTFSQKKILVIIKEIVSIGTEYIPQLPYTATLHQLKQTNKIVQYELKVNADRITSSKNIFLYPNEIMGEDYQFLDDRTQIDLSNNLIYFYKVDENNNSVLTEERLVNYVFSIPENFDYKKEIRIEYPLHISAYVQLVLDSNITNNQSSDKISNSYQVIIKNNMSSPLKLEDFEFGLVEIHQLYDFQLRPVSINKLTGDWNIQSHDNRVTISNIDSNHLMQFQVIVTEEKSNSVTPSCLSKKQAVRHLLPQHKIENYFITDITETLCVDIVKSTSWYNVISSRAQIKKYRDLFYLRGHDPDNHKWNTLLYNSTSNNSDALEAVYFTEAIKMRLYPNSIKERLHLKNTDSARNKYIRLVQLKYHVEQQYYKVIGIANKSIFTSMFDRESLNDDETIRKLQCHLLEAFFSLRESIKIIQMYNPGYIIGYSYLATAHAWAGQWCELYENIKSKYNALDQSKRDVFRKQISDKNQEINKANGKKKQKLINKRDDLKKQLSKLPFLKEQLKELLGASSLNFLGRRYQYEMALINYHAVLQMHTEGLAYKNHLCDLYVLEDHYNDSLTHFNLSLERFQVNTQEIRNRIDKLKAIVDKSRLYYYENYTNSFVEESE